MVETKNADNSANSNNDKEKEKKKPTFKEKVKFYVTFTAASVGKMMKFIGKIAFNLEFYIE